MSLPKVAITKSKFLNETPTATETLPGLETAFYTSFTTNILPLKKWLHKTATYFSILTFLTPTIDMEPK